MFATLQTIGTAAAPYLIQAAKDVISGFVKSKFGDAQKGSVTKTFGDCLNKVTKAIGAKAAIAMIKSRQADGAKQQRAMNKKASSYASRKRKMQNPIAQMQQEMQDYNEVPVKRRPKYNDYELDQQ